MTTLEQERVDAMRTTIMDAVDADVATRGRRGRRVVASLVASCFVVGIGGIGLQVVSPDRGGDSTSSSIATSDSMPPRAESRRDAVLDEARPSSPSSAPGAERDVVTTGRVSVEVDDARRAAADLVAWVEQRGGRVDERRESGTGGSASAQLVVRVPSVSVDATVRELRRLGAVQDVSIERSDVSGTRRDLDARIRGLEISIARLEKILADARSSADLLRTERALSQRQGQLESLQAQRTALADRIDLSSLRVELSPATRPTADDPGDGFVDGLRTGWHALTDAVRSTVHAVGVLLPWVLVLVAAVGGWRLLRRTRR